MDGDEVTMHPDWLAAPIVDRIILIDTRKETCRFGHPILGDNYCQYGHIKPTPKW